MKRADAKADTSELEPEIDRLVYELYELAPEEVKIVEKAGGGVAAVNRRTWEIEKR